VTKARLPPSPPASSPAVRRVMQGNGPFNTRPEVRLRSRLHRRGRRFRVGRWLSFDGIRMRPDIIFPRARVAVFVDGCFWHSCPDHGRTPSTNREYWTAKLERNRRRDQRQTDALERAGWTVVRVWEHEAPGAAANLVEAVLEAAVADAPSSVST
jgi:DNA mismatch endonuclease (patch repair protein)